MFKDIIPIFESKYNKEGKDRIITDDYVLKPGRYILIKKDQIEDLIVTGNKKELETERLHPLYKFFSELDYNSSLISMNKSIDISKQVHSNNIYSFFFKIEKKSNITQDIITGYYNILKNPYLKYTKNLQKEMYKAVEEKIGYIDIDKVDKIENYIKENLDKLIETYPLEKGYFKIFFDVPVEEYIKEGSRYFLSNIYNVVDYNTKIDNQLYGIPGVNLGCNQDKPNLKHRGKAPFLLPLEDALIQKKISDYLGNCASNQKYNIYIDIDNKNIYALTNQEGLNQEKVEGSFKGIYLRIQKSTELEIIDYSIISNFKSNIKNLKIEDYIGRDIKNYKFLIQRIETLKQLELLVDEKFFNKFMVNSYFRNPEKLSNATIKQALINNKEALFTWFYKGDSTRFKNSYKKFTLDLIYNAIENNNLIHAIERFNVRMSLTKYFGGAIVNLYEVRDKLTKELDENERFKFSSDDNYSFAVGQLASYLTSQSQASEKTFSLGMPILKARYKNIINTELSRLFNKYGYRISQNNRRFNKLYVAILDYNPSSINQDMLLAGYMMNNLIYTKNKGVQYTEECIIKEEM